MRIMSNAWAVFGVWTTGGKISWKYVNLQNCKKRVIETDNTCVLSRSSFHDLRGFSLQHYPKFGDITSPFHFKELGRFVERFQI